MTVRALGRSRFGHNPGTVDFYIRRADLQLGVAYRKDLDRVRQVLLATAVA